MSKLSLLILPFLMLIMACQPKPMQEEKKPQEQPQEQEMILSVSSPDGKIQLDFLTGSFGRPGYTVSREGKMMIDTSFLGLYLENADNLDHFFSPVKTTLTKFDETQQPSSGEEMVVSSDYNELHVQLEESADRLARMDLKFRVYNSGLAFRYLIPEQAGLPDSIFIKQEVTDFKLTADHECCWILTDSIKDEGPCDLSKVSEIRGQDNRVSVKTPFSMRTEDSLFLSIHEAAFGGYSRMSLWVDKESLTLYSRIGEQDGVTLRGKLPFQSPWRTIHIGSKTEDISTSQLIQNLVYDGNE